MKITENAKESLTHSIRAYLRVQTKAILLNSTTVGLCFHAHRLCRYKISNKLKTKIEIVKNLDIYQFPHVGACFRLSKQILYSTIRLAQKITSMNVFEATENLKICTRLLILYINPQ